MARSRKGEKKRNRDRWSTLLATRLPWLLIVPLGLAIPAIASQNPHEVERVYSQSIYPAVRTALSAVSSLFSFSLAELFLIIAVLSIAAVVIIRLIQLVFRKIRVVRFSGLFSGWRSLEECCLIPSTLHGESTTSGRD